MFFARAGVSGCWIFASFGVAYFRPDLLFCPCAPFFGDQLQDTGLSGAKASWCGIEKKKGGNTTRAIIWGICLLPNVAGDLYYKDRRRVPISLLLMGRRIDTGAMRAMYFRKHGREVIVYIGIHFQLTARALSWGVRDVSSSLILLVGNDLCIILRQ